MKKPFAIGIFCFFFSIASAFSLEMTVFGDHDRNETAKRIANLAASLEPDVHLLVGDWHYSSSEKKAKKWWDEVYAPLRQSGSILLFALGNHEALPSFQFNMDLVGMTQSWYAMRLSEHDEEDETKSNDVYLIVLDSNLYSCPKQLSFLKAALAESRKARWQVVAFHHPPFSSGEGHGSNLKVRSKWSPLFDEYGVDLVLTGHDHIYERTHPVCSDGSLNTRCPIYIVTGGGGRSLYPVTKEQPYWSRSRFKEHHFMKLTFLEDKIEVDAIKQDGSILDSFDGYD